MSNRHRPDYYRAPLKKRADIVAFLTGHQSYYYGGRSGSSPLAWNVKAPGVDLSFEHLIEVYRKSGEYDGRNERWLDYPEWRQAARETYNEVEDRIWEWGIEGARRGIEDDDAYRMLWDGTPLAVEYDFAGRSGGWLLMMKFQGYDLGRMEDYEFADWLGDIEYPMLRKLYKLVVQNDHDFGRKKVENSIEFHAAFDLIVNACADIPRPDKTQLTLPGV